VGRCQLPPQPGRSLGCGVCGFGFRDSVSGFGFRVSGSGVRVSGFGVRISGSGGWVPGFKCRVEGSGCKLACIVEGSGCKLECRVEGSGYRVGGLSTWYARASESEIGKSCSTNLWPPICFGLEFEVSGSV